MKKIIFVLIIIIILIVIFVKLYKIKTKSDSGDTAEEFVNKLDELGYFKYAKKEDAPSLKKEMLEIIRKYGSEGTLTTLWDENTNVAKDYRFYFCDGETVFEGDGIPDLINDLQPSFEKFGVKIKIDSFSEEWDDEKGLSTKIKINGTEYEIFKNFKKSGWGEAPMRIAHAINKELEKKGINEKIYLISGGNDGKLVFLTEDQHKYIYNFFKNSKEKPLELNEWGKVMKTEPLNF